MAQARITAPKRAKRGEIIEIRALLQHPMETGYRRSSEGALLPRDLVRRFTCHFVETGKTGAGDLVFAATLHAAIAANPFLSFDLRAGASGTLQFSWEGDNGFSHREQVSFAVGD